MAVWQKALYAPATGSWHEILAAGADMKISFFQILNISTSEQSRVVVGISDPGDVGILAPTGLSLQETGAIGTTSYEYVVTAVKADGRETDASSQISITTGTNTLSVDNYHTLSWSAVSGATKYRLYCRIGGSASLLIKVVELTALTYSNKGEMLTAEKWPWINMTAVSGMLAWCDLAPGTGLEPISRPVPIKVGSTVSLYTTGTISVFASGEV